VKFAVILVRSSTADSGQVKLTASRLADELATGSLVEYATADIVILTSTLLRRSVYFTGTISSEAA
jgi:hypothetical protein